MIRLNFICEFKSDIVLHSSSNTEGKVDRFDYIAGSNFLGMVAREYPSFGADAFDVFHSGAVRFGDGHILNNKKQTFHIPFSWFAPKGLSFQEAKDENELFNEYFLTKEKYDKFIADNKQLKQQRAGFITYDGHLVKPKHNYRQKSAYDKKNRRSLDKSMFGYYALPKGTKWLFSVEMDSDTYRDKIIDILKNSNRLGKSRSAEYGHIKISYLKEEIDNIKVESNPISIENKHYIFLYAYSRLALTNGGINSYQFDLDSLKLDTSAKIAWDKSHIRTSRYTPYVSARDNRDPERLIIDKGSVIAIEVDSSFDVSKYSQNISRGVGLYLSEGHGKVIVNPTFLITENPIFEDSVSSLNIKNSSLEYGVINSWLEKQQEDEEQNYELLKSVKKFIKDNTKYIKNKKAQWGQIRSMCNAFVDSDKLYDELFSEDIVNNHKKGFLLHGLAEKKWDKKLIDALKAEYDETKEYHSFIKLLSIYAPKVDDKGESNE